MTLPKEPLLFTPRMTPTIWGGHLLQDNFNKHPEDSSPIGESWEICGLPGFETTVSQGPFSNRSLSTLMQNYPTELLGNRFASASSFPLLIKFIDAHDALSVQVHPDDHAARQRYSEPNGKTECWYIVHAGPSARLCIGLQDQLSKDELRSAISGGTLERHLSIFPVHEGEFYFIPAGTIHAILGDVLIYEVQQSSNTTFRMYDWQRLDANGKPRMLHIDDAISVADLSIDKKYRTKPLALQEDDAFIRRLGIVSPSFAVETLLWKKDQVIDIAAPADSCRILSLTEGNAALIWESGRRSLKKGSTVLLPASLKECSVQGEKGCICMSTYIPDIEKDIILPLRQSGIPFDTIAALGLLPSEYRRDYSDGNS